MEIIVISRKTIKPSKPTPHHLRHFQLTFLDQLSTRTVIPYIFYYSSVPEKSTTHQLLELKNSLAETLAKFYPLAGRLKDDDYYINCNDEGALFSEAIANCLLSRVVENPNSFQLNKLLPLDRLEDAGELLLAVQVTTFHCGGMAIGVCMSHRIADGLSISTFVNYWAALAASKTELYSEGGLRHGESAAHFPPTDMSCYKYTEMPIENAVGKRFLFSSSAISALKDRCAAKTGLKPTRVEVLMDFIWSRFVGSTKASGSRGLIYRVGLAVNLRAMLSSPLPESAFGNYIWFAMAFIPTAIDRDAEEESSYVLLGRLREQLGKIDRDYVRELREGSFHFAFSKKQEGEDGSRQEPRPQEEVPPKKMQDAVDGDHFFFSSLSRFPLYKADFGWGRPLWVSFATLPFKNKVVFFPTPPRPSCDVDVGGGIEAWINLKDDDMAKLEADKEFLKFVCQSGSAKFIASPGACTARL